VDTNLRRKTPGLICTCNDLYIDDLVDSITAGCDEAEDVMFDHNTQFRCVQCKPIIEKLIKKHEA
jgi:NAD(P)H-nitrite reductase large subunit